MKGAKVYGTIPATIRTPHLYIIFFAASRLVNVKVAKADNDDVELFSLDDPRTIEIGVIQGITVTIQGRQPPRSLVQVSTTIFFRI